MITEGLIAEEPDGALDAERRSDCEQLVADYCSRHEIPGAAYTIVREGRIVHRAGAGLADIAAERPANADSVWPIASLTKSFTAVAALQQVEAGRLSLDRPVTDYLPQLRVADSDTTRSLTLRKLLSHSAGLGRTGHQDKTRERLNNPFPTRESLIAGLGDVVAQSRGGAHFSYSNEGYALAGHLVETVARTSLETLFQTEILDPCGMRDTFVRFADWRAADNRALPYCGPEAGAFDSGERHGDFVVVRLVEDYQTFLSTGGIASTANDIARYQIATMRNEDSPLGLSAGALDLMQSVQFPYGATGWGYGLGYWVMWSGAAKLIGHSGGLPGVSNYSLMVPGRGDGVVVLLNRGERSGFKLAEQLLAAATGERFFERDEAGALKVPRGPRAPEIDTRQLETYAGRYRHRQREATVSPVGERLVIAAKSRYGGVDERTLIMPLGNDGFLELGKGGYVGFTRDDAGRVAGMLLSGYAFERLR